LILEEISFIIQEMDLPPGTLALRCLEVREAKKKNPDYFYAKQMAGTVNRSGSLLNI
jgi:hypothetical protein